MVAGVDSPVLGELRVTGESAMVLRMNWATSTHPRTENGIRGLPRELSV